ncbi:hypothetical protein [Ureibacillus aquaedulcis]|uniref:Uncharacterized protein n=1 Tax=Ureibacillus aquaedulcis TaxID=3058421 RepID=A0ABT8GSQ4_9BACL|nr:hypothetical protein [Ureibacillus sp. BA0131]MDN4494450.1 hypothetical protein [Ureibacillus sp. BA0131]
MKNQLIRVIAILLLGMLVYINTYEESGIGLAAFFAYVELLIVTFLIGIPIIFLFNKISLGNKVGLLILTMIIAAIIPQLGFGKLKYVLEDHLINKEMEIVENDYSVELQRDNVFLTFDNHLLVGNIDDLMGNMDKTLLIYNKSGKEINRIKVTQLAKAAVPYLPLTNKQKVTTYFDGMDTQEIKYDLFKKVKDNDIQFAFRYVTTDAPEDYNPEPDMPSDARDIKYHYMITYSPVLDESGEFVFSSDTFHLARNNQSILVSYIAEGIEAIVAPSSAVLVNEID